LPAAGQNQGAIETMLAIEVPNLRSPLARAPLTNALLEQTLFFSQVEVHRGNRKWYYG
jgi:hypothetical protein